MGCKKNHFDIPADDMCPRCGKFIDRDEMGREINPPEVSMPTPVLSDEELDEMFYGNREPEPESLSSLSGTDRLSAYALSVVVLFGGYGVLYLLYRIGVDCLRRLGL